MLHLDLYFVLDESNCMFACKLVVWRSSDCIQKMRILAGKSKLILISGDISVAVKSNRCFQDTKAFFFLVLNEELTKLHRSWSNVKLQIIEQCCSKPEQERQVFCIDSAIFSLCKPANCLAVKGYFRNLMIAIVK